MPPLITKWNVLKDEDKDLFPLLEVSVWYIAQTENNCTLCSHYSNILKKSYIFHYCYKHQSVCFIRQITKDCFCCFHK